MSHAGGNHETRPLSAARIPQVARLLAAAFDDDPVYGFLFPDPETRRRGLEDFFTRNLGTHLPHRCTYVLTHRERTDEVLATVTVRPPAGVPISLLTMLRRGLLPYAIDHGLDAVRRMLLAKKLYDGLERELSRDEPHFDIHLMAVAPEHQGRGLGARLLHQALEQAAREAGAKSAQVPVVLTTHKERNVTFYRRAGFELAYERWLEPRPDIQAYRVWGMRRG